MNKFASALVALAIALPTATPALAQYPGNRNDDRHGPAAQHRDDRRHGPAAQHRDDRHDNRRGPVANGPARPGFNRVQAGNPFRKGQRFEMRRAPNYRVVDYRQYRRLGPPPRGYHWVRSGNDALLVAIGTGVIASVIANNF